MPFVFSQRTVWLETAALFPIWWFINNGMHPSGPQMKVKGTITSLLTSLRIQISCVFSQQLHTTVTVKMLSHVNFNHFTLLIYRVYIFIQREKWSKKIAHWFMYLGGSIQHSQWLCNNPYLSRTNPIPRFDNYFFKICSRRFIVKYFGERT